jgi:L-2-hydroxyglutarate oxidase LhgO
MTTPDFDVVVIGAGVVGLAVARACGAQGLQVLVLETADCVGSGISSRNSEVLHAGLYYPTGSLKAMLCVRGREALYQYCADRGIAHRRCGKLVVATNPAQHPRLERLYEQAVRNGVRDLVWLSAGEARELESAVSCTKAFLSPSSGIVDSHALLQALVADIEALGGWICLRTGFRGAVRERGVFSVSTRSGEEDSSVSCRWLVNSAGLDAVHVAQQVVGLSAAFIPRAHFAKGHYFSVHGYPFRHLVYPLPAEAGLGIHATLQLDGQVRFGPDVEWVKEINYNVDSTRVHQFYAAIRSYWQDLPDGALQPAYAGIRPKISGPSEPPADFVVSDPAEHGCEGLINLFGIESPGLTASLALGDAVACVVRN